MKSLIFALTFVASTALAYTIPAAKIANADADAAYEALLRSFWQPARRDFVGDGNYWFYAHSIDVAAMALKRNPTRLNQDRLKELISAQQARGFIQRQHPFFDDENWMAISLAFAAEVTGDRSYLDRAVELFEDILKRGTIGRKEGVWWNDEHKLVATAINAGVVITGVRLWRQTSNVRYLEFARKNYDYWRRTMVRADGFVHDSFQGTDIAQHTFSYDQGLMIGGAVELYRATRQRRYLTEARLYAEYMLKHMVSASGVMLEELCISRRQECMGWKDVAQFKGIGVRYLVELARELPDDKPLARYLVRTAQSLAGPAVFDRRAGKIAYEWDGTVLPAAGTHPTTNSGALALGALATLYQ